MVEVQGEFDVHVMDDNGAFATQKPTKMTWAPPKSVGGWEIGRGGAPPAQVGVGAGTSTMRSRSLRDARRAGPEHRHTNVVRGATERQRFKCLVTY